MPEKIRRLGRAELIALYTTTQFATADEIDARLKTIAGRQEVEGWMLLECQMLDSSRMGDRVIVPYGPGCTFKEVPDHPISPRGLASDMSSVIAVTEEVA